MPFTSLAFTLLRTLRYPLLLSFTLAIAIQPKLLAQEVLYVGIGSSPVNKVIFPTLFAQFEAETKIKIIPTRLNDIKRLDEKQSWFTSHGEPIDVIFGQLSQRLQTYYKQGKLRSLNAFWQENNLDEGFAHLKKMSTYDGQILGLPYKLFSWQIFYIPSKLGKNFTPPKTLETLREMCIYLDNQGITPFHIAEKSPYVQMAWFEYITLRTYGLEYFYRLMQGSEPFTSDKVKQVLTIWQSLILANCFSDKLGATSWKDNLQFFFNKQSAFYFIGINLSTYLKSIELTDKVNFFTFPQINQIPRYESVPVNAIHISALSKKPKQSYQLLKFLARADVQETLNHITHTLPANKFSQPPSDDYSKGLSKIILEAAGTSAFIDRVSLPAFEIQSRPHFNEFAKTGNVKLLMERLEKLRVEIYH